MLVMLDRHLDRPLTECLRLQWPPRRTPKAPGRARLRPSSSPDRTGAGTIRLFEIPRFVAFVRSRFAHVCSLLLQSCTQFTTNPTPLALGNGSVLLLYKARSREDWGKMSTGVAFCDHWSGPCRKIGGAIAGIPGACEDAGIYQSPTSGVFRIILHCGCS